MARTPPRDIVLAERCGMHRLDPIGVALPVFLPAIVVEIAVARRRGLHVYRFFDTIADRSCGVS